MMIIVFPFVIVVLVIMWYPPVRERIPIGFTGI